MRRGMKGGRFHQWLRVTGPTERPVSSGEDGGADESTFITDGVGASSTTYLLRVGKASAMSGMAMNSHT